MYGRPRPVPNLRIEEYESRALVGNPLDDPVRRRYVAVLPPTAEAGGGRNDRFPVVIVLAGFGGDGLGQLNHDPFRWNVAEIATELMASGEAPPAILVLPDAFTSLGGSQYLDSPALGAYSRAIADDLVDAVDERLPTRPEARHRAIAGKSSGGYGALRLAAARPDRFSACIAHAPDALFELCYLPDLPLAFRVLAGFGGSPEAFVRAWWETPAPPKDWFAALNVVAMSAAYSPRIDGGFDLPFDRDTGEIIADVWQRWKEHDPAAWPAERLAALRSLRFLWLDAGDRDEFRLDVGARTLSRRLLEAGVDHHFEIFSGGHFGIGWRWRSSLAPLLHHLASR